MRSLERFEVWERCLLLRRAVTRGAWEGMWATSRRNDQTPADWKQENPGPSFTVPSNWKYPTIWMRLEVDSSLEPLKRTSWFWLWKMIKQMNHLSHSVPELLIYELWDKNVLFEATKFMVICYDNNKKLIHVLIRKLTQD